MLHQRKEDGQPLVFPLSVETSVSFARQSAAFFSKLNTLIRTFFICLKDPLVRSRHYGWGTLNVERSFMAR